MVNYNKHRCDKIYEEQGEVGLTYFLKNGELKKQTFSRLKNIYSISTWTGDAFTDSPLRMIYDSLKLFLFGTAMFLTTLLVTVFGFVIAPASVLYRVYKNYQLYQDYLEEEK